MQHILINFLIVFLVGCKPLQFGAPAQKKSTGIEVTATPVAGDSSSTDSTILSGTQTNTDNTTNTEPNVGEPDDTQTSTLSGVSVGTGSVDNTHTTPTPIPTPTQTPTPTPTPSPTPEPPCAGGVKFNNICWYMSANNFCNVCNGKDGVNAATWTYAGAGPHNCAAVANALGAPVDRVDSMSYQQRIAGSPNPGVVSRIDACVYMPNFRILTSFYGGGEQGYLGSGNMVCACNK